MFERFTDRARRSVVLAQEEARQLGKDRIGSDLILLGLVREGEGIAAQVLELAGVHAHAVREQIGSGTAIMAGQIVAFDAGTKKVLDLSLREALQLGHNYIGTEHLLLAIVREDGAAADLLRRLGVDTPDIRDRVLAVILKYQPKPPRVEATSQTRWSELPSIWKDAAVEAVLDAGHGDVPMDAVAVIACALWNVANALAAQERA